MAVILARDTLAAWTHLTVWWTCRFIIHLTGGRLPHRPNTVEKQEGSIWVRVDKLVRWTLLSRRLLTQASI